jgi:RNA polymerase-binding protein DksA
MAKQPKKKPEDKKEKQQPQREQLRPHAHAGETYLSPEELKQFKSLLLEKRGEIIGDVSSMESDALKKTRSEAGDLSNMPIHMADLGTDNYEQEFALGLLDSERKLLHEINDALLRIEDGSYGICEGTGEPIPQARLEANPWARYSVKYASLLEKGLVTEPEQGKAEPKKRKGRKRKADEEEEAEYQEVEEEEAEEEEEEEEEELEDEDEEEEEENELDGFHEENGEEPTEEEEFY